jgi:mannan endo-1,4-beta-mannosidase
VNPGRPRGLTYAAIIFLLGVLFVPGCSSQAAAKSIYWGALIKGDTYGLDDAPWDERAIDMFEKHAGKELSILHWGQPWWRCTPTCGYQSFRDQVAQYDAVRNRGVVPLIDWASWDYSVDPVHDQPKFSLATIINGDHDAYIRQWATEARDWGHPFFLRLDWEMNGNWFPWSEARNGNSPGQFAQAWRHVHDIFSAVGATNVTWVWCPNADYPGAIPLENLYPGDDYVDWTAVDGYNFGTNPVQPNRWQSFYELFKPTYDRLLQLSPGKPIMIAETSCTEIGGSKAGWITDVLTAQLPTHFPQVEALLWFNWNHAGFDWAIESSQSAQDAFAQAIASPYYAGSRFADLSISPIPALSALPQPDSSWRRVFMPWLLASD